MRAIAKTCFYSLCNEASWSTAYCSRFLLLREADISQVVWMEHATIHDIAFPGSLGPRLTVIRRTEMGKQSPNFAEGVDRTQMNETKIIHGSEALIKDGIAGLTVVLMARER